MWRYRFFSSRFIVPISFAVIIGLFLVISCGKGKEIMLNEPGTGSIQLQQSSELQIAQNSLTLSETAVLYDNLLELPPDLAVNIISRSGFSLVPFGENQDFDPRLNRYLRLDVSEKYDETVVVVSVEGISDMKFALLEINYDPATFTPYGIEFGDFLGGPDETIRLGILDNAGKIPIGIARIRYRENTGVSGSGVIATLRFQQGSMSQLRMGSKVPGEPDNQVNLTNTDPLGFRGSLTEKNVGDYDNSGEVGVADITPIALHYLDAADSSIGASNADGDNDGTVGVPDITPIANHYLNVVAGYHIYRLISAAMPAPADFTATDPWLTRPRPSGLNGDMLFPTYTFDDPDSADNIWYAAAPFDLDGNVGILSNPLQGNEVVTGEAPTVTIDSPEDGSIVSGIVTITATVVPGDEPVTKVDLLIDDVQTQSLASEPYSFSWDSSTVSQGEEHAIRVVATDLAELTGSDAITVSTPSFTIEIAPEDQKVFDTDTVGVVPVEVTTDFAGTLDVSFTLDGAPAGVVSEPPYTFSWIASAAELGAHEIGVSADDSAGTVIEDSVTYYVVQTNGFLPIEWYQAKAYLGLIDATMGTGADIFGFAEGTQPNSWNWTDYQDLGTMLDIYWDAWFTAPEDFPIVMQDMGDELGAATGIQDILLSATDEALPQHRIDRQTHTETIDPDDPLAVAVADFVTAAGGTPDLSAYKAALATMSKANQNALTPVIYASRDALVARNDVFDSIDGFDAGVRQQHFNYAHGSIGGMAVLAINLDNFIVPIWNPETNWMRAFPIGSAFFEGAALISDAIDDLSDYMASSPAFENVSLNVETPAGYVTIGGTGDDVHTVPGENGHAILIDLGGDDTYDCHAGGTASAMNGVAVSIDLGNGTDTYNRLDDPDDFDRSVGYSDDDTSQQGAGRYGIGILVDYGGNDEYHSVRMSQGSAVFGVGILADFGGDDSYEMEALGQGGAFSGVGILIDDDGVDSYEAWAKSQGFGAVNGIGYLVDRGGAGDTYLAHPEENAGKPEYYADVYGTNMSNCQGAGWGSRWGWVILNDGTDDIYIVGSGGLGLLFDDGGDDDYTCGTFGQGSGFYQSVGMLIDLDGIDDHVGHWYTSGATAHVAVAGLWDGGGDDNYTNDVSIGIGGSHDWSITWFLELGGDDIYSSAGLGLGCGYSNGMGYFLDFAGDDSYDSTAGDAANTTLGKGNLGDADRPGDATYGIFIDIAGDDIYAEFYADMLGSDGATIVPTPDDASTWIRNGGDQAIEHGFYPNGKGCGIDSE